MTSIQKFVKAVLASSVITLITQLVDRRYDQELLDRGVSRILYLGLAFKGKAVAMAHRFRK